MIWIDINIVTDIHCRIGYTLGTTGKGHRQGCVVWAVYLSGSWRIMAQRQPDKWTKGQKKVVLRKVPPTDASSGDADIVGSITSTL